MKDPEKEVKDFLAKEGLTALNPRALIDGKREQEAQLRYEQWENHLSAVAQEALRVENGEFVHSSANSVMRALKTKIADGSDPRLMSSFKDKTLANQVFTAGRNLSEVYRRVEANNSTGRSLSLLSSITFFQIAPAGWHQTLLYASEVLPKETTVDDIVFLLLRFPEYSKLKSAQERVNAAKIS